MGLFKTARMNLFESVINLKSTLPLILLQIIFLCVANEDKLNSELTYYDPVPAAKIKNSSKDSNYSEFTFETIPDFKVINVSPTSSIKLMTCGTALQKNLWRSREFIMAPSFSPTTMGYSLRQFRLENEPHLKGCSKEDQFIRTTAISKERFDEELQEFNKHDEEFIFILLRTVTVLQDNGYLSVGSGGINMTYYSPEEYCIDDASCTLLNWTRFLFINGKSMHRGSGERLVVDFRLCLNAHKSRPIFRKCCPLGMHMEKTDCVSDNGLHEGLARSDDKVFDVDTMKLREFGNAHPIITNPLLGCDAEWIEEWDEDGCAYEFYPATNNGVAYIGAHRSWEILSPDSNFCMDQKRVGRKEYTNVVVRCAGNETLAENRSKRRRYKARVSFIYMISAFIGAVFNFLTAFIYLITWRKQNAHGKILCSCTFSLFFMELFLGFAHLLGQLKNQRNSMFCVANGICAQYFMIAAFSWLLVVNYDLWGTFRSIKLDDSNGDGRLQKLSVFGWGFPAIVTFISLCMEFSFSCRVSGVPVPEYGHNICLVAPWAQGYYIYYILSILMAMSIAYSSLTLIGLYNYKKDTNQLRSTRMLNNKQNTLLFLKLSLLMGLTWLFEVVSWATTKEDVSHVVWIILDLYNALSSILIFAIFACKKSIWSMAKPVIYNMKFAKISSSEVATTRL